MNTNDDKSEEHDIDNDRDERDIDDAFSVSNISDEGNASLVGFGEGANSTISGPTSRPAGLNRVSSGARPTSMNSNSNARVNPLASYLQQQSQQQEMQEQGAGDTAMRMSPSPAGSNTPEPMEGSSARMLDGMTFDNDVVDTTVRTPRLASPWGE